MSVFKDFPGLENLEKLFRDFQGPTRALCWQLLKTDRPEALEPACYFITLQLAHDNTTLTYISYLNPQQNFMWMDVRMYGRPVLTGLRISRLRSNRIQIE